MIWLPSGRQHFPLSVSTSCISGHIFSEEIEDIQRNWYEEKNRITMKVRVWTLALGVGNNTSLSSPLVRMRKTPPPLWEDGALQMHFYVGGQGLSRN